MNLYHIKCIMFTKYNNAILTCKIYRKLIFIPYSFLLAVVSKGFQESMNKIFVLLKKV